MHIFLQSFFLLLLLFFFTFSARSLFFYLTFTIFSSRFVNFFL